MLTLVFISDGVLTISSVRFGSGEIEGVLERSVSSALIDDAICVGRHRPQDRDESILLLTNMRSEHKLDLHFDEASLATISHQIA